MPAFLKATAALLAAIPLASATLPPKKLGPGDLYPQVVQVDCFYKVGSAFAITNGNYVSVEHVTKNVGCTINGQRIDATPEPGLDFAIIKGNAKSGFKVNCAGIKPWRWVFAIGYARGYRWQTMVMLYATPWKTDDGMQVLLGPPSVIPGQSGGVILDENGEAVGTINRYLSEGPAASFVRPLADTSLCRHS